MAHQAYEMLLMVDSTDNNYKFYELILESDGKTVVTRWGRISSGGQSKTSYGGKSEFDRTLRAKLAKGYVRSKAVNMTSSTSTDKIALAEAARRDLLGTKALDKNSEMLIKLVDRLTQMNRHQIVAASNGQIKVDDSGLMKTELGFVTASTIEEARILLTKLEINISKKNFSTKIYKENLESYLTLIPQKIPSKRGWGEIFFTEHSSLTAQSSLLDQLEGSLDLYKQKEKDILSQMAKGSKIEEKVFATNLEMVEDPVIIKRIEKFYNDNKNIHHVSSHLKLKNVYAVKHDDFETRFLDRSKKIGNIRQLWHGTRAFNVLSIFKNGLIIPKSNGSYHITGRMFGNGVYFSDQSTKALNYSYGYWGGGQVEDNCFMFVADVAMGKEHIPEVYQGQKAYPVKGYDSVFAKAGKANIKNNEMIVYDLAQVHLRYLCEFSPK